MRPQARLLALLPTALVAILTLWSGTFQGAATSTGALVSQVMILGVCLCGIAGLSDPLRLGHPARWLVPAMLALTLVSWWLSPVARAGTTGLILLPAVLLIPSSIARCWADETRRGWGSASLGALTLVVAVVALVRWQTLSLPRASLPLGHHNLLACWLVLVLPLTTSGLSRPGWQRWLALASGLTGLLALVATGSLLGIIAVVVQLMIAFYWWPRTRLWAVSFASIGMLVAAPRLWTIAQATDISSLARGSYLAAGWQGLSSRPVVGWGPGAVPWTLAKFMEPVVGVHPASEIIGDLHSLPAQIAYELGVPGLLMSVALVGIFTLRRWREYAKCSAPVSRQAALLGLMGGGVFALGAAPLAVPALPVTAAVIAGACFGNSIPPLTRGRVAIVWAYVLIAVALLIPLDRAHQLYDRARRAPSAAASHSLLLQAHDIDPAFPLYLAREAWLATEIQGVDLAIADRARKAAEMAPGLAPLWLEAGNLGNQAGASWAPEALAKAHQLDPLSPLTAFHRMTVTFDLATATKLGFDAVTGEPRLARAVWWFENPDLARSVSQLTQFPIPGPKGSLESQPMVLALSFDNRPARSFSLFAFRRTPWPGWLAPVDLVAD